MELGDPGPAIVGRMARGETLASSMSFTESDSYELDEPERANF